MADSPNKKRAKMELNSESTETGNQTACKFFVKRKKRYCRLTRAKNSEYCGEHIPLTENSLKIVDANDSTPKHNVRVPCPLDPKHTVCARKLHNHLKICNALVKDRPDFIVPGLNAGLNVANDSNESTDFKLCDVDKEIVDQIVDKIQKLYELHKIDERIDDLTASHPLLESELNNQEYGYETLRHLTQTSTILGYLNYYKLFDDYVSYVEYGAGKGQVSYWLAQAIANYPNSNVLLIDRASVRHKKDNKLDESHAVQRIRADIADFDISKHGLIQKSKQIVGIGKHLCGAATDFSLRCSIHGNDIAQANANAPKTIAILIALCCHHRCDWKHFVGQDFFIENGVSAKEFAIMTKMVGWAICGTGQSRERRKQMEEQKANGNIPVPDEVDSTPDTKNLDPPKRNQHQRKEIGQKCKRLIDFARIRYMEQNGFKCSLKRYVSSDITLENVCLVALRKT